MPSSYGERLDLVPSSAAQRKFLTINPEEDVDLVKGLSSPMRLQILGFRATALSDAERTRLGLKPDQSAMKVAELPPGWLKEANRGAEKAGLKKGDVIVGFEGRTTFAEKDLLGFAIQERKPGETMTVAVLRGGERLDLRFAVK